MNKLEFRLLKIIIIINKCIDGFHNHPTPTPQDKQAHTSRISQRIGFQVVEFTVVKLTEKLTWRQSDTVYNICILNQRKKFDLKNPLPKTRFQKRGFVFQVVPRASMPCSVSIISCMFGVWHGHFYWLCYELLGSSLGNDNKRSLSLLHVTCIIGIGKTVDELRYMNPKLVAQ